MLLSELASQTQNLEVIEIEFLVPDDSCENLAGQSCEVSMDWALVVTVSVGIHLGHGG